MNKFKRDKWEIGHYIGNNSICINLEFNGKKYHRHDYGVSLIPRFIRLGYLITKLEKESGILKYRNEILEKYQQN